MRLSAASLWNVQNGEELAYCEIQYRSDDRKFATWADNNAGLFRAELHHFAEAVSSTIIQQLAVPAWREEEVPLLASHVTK